MAAHSKEDREKLAKQIKDWNASRLDLFHLSPPNENLEFFGVMRFYFQAEGEKVATKCIRVSSTACTGDVIASLVEKFRPDMRMLSLPPVYCLYEVHVTGEERKLRPEEIPLVVQLFWGNDLREGRFLLKREQDKTLPVNVSHGDLNQNTMSSNSLHDQSMDGSTGNFKRKLSKREKKELKKKEKEAKLKNMEGDGGDSVAEKLYNELPDTSFTRSLSNPEMVMRRRRQMKLEKKLEQFRSKDGGPDTGGTLKIYGQSVVPDVPYKTLLVSVFDTVEYVVKETLNKYGLDKEDPDNFCLTQMMGSAGEEGGQPKSYMLSDEDCPLSIFMQHNPAYGSITFHLIRRPPDMPKRKKKASAGGGRGEPMEELLHRFPFLLEVNPDGSEANKARRFPLSLSNTEIGSERSVGGQYITLHGMDIAPRHCTVAHHQQGNEGIVTVTPSRPDTPTFINGQHITQTTVLHPGMVLQLGKGHFLRFCSPLQHESPTGGPGSVNAAVPQDPRGGVGPVQDPRGGVGPGQDPRGGVGPGQDPRGLEPQETTFDMDGQVKSSLDPSRLHSLLPASLEFRDSGEDAFLAAVISEMDGGSVQFKLAPTYTLYMVMRYRIASLERANVPGQERPRWIVSLANKMAHRISQAIQEHVSDASMLSFWMANASELLHFIKQDNTTATITANQAQDILAESVQVAFTMLVDCMQAQLHRVMPAFLDPNFSDLQQDNDMVQHMSQKGKPNISDVIQTLSSAMSLLRRCRVNAALTIQLFSQLFHFVNMWLFNKLVTEPQLQLCTHDWGHCLKRRLGRLEIWAEKQGLELAADCHLARIIQAAHLLEAPKSSAEDIASISSTCFKLNSLQLRSLLTNYLPSRGEPPRIPPDLIDSVVAVAQSTADELTRSDGKDVKLEEDADLQLPFLLPEDGYSCDIVKGIPNALPDFIQPIAKSGMCKLSANPNAAGTWMVYMGPREPENLRASGKMAGPGEMAPPPNQAAPPPSHMAPPSGPPSSWDSNQQLVPPGLPKEPEVITVTFNKVKGSLGLSIVAAKGERQRDRGIYIKSVVEGGGAAMDGRLKAGDQLLEVDGRGLIGQTQEKAAEYMTQTGQTVTLRVARQAAIYHGLATLLNQPSPVMTRAAGGPNKMRPMSEVPHEGMMAEGRAGPRPLAMQHGAQSSPALAGMPQHDPYRQDHPADPYGGANPPTSTGYPGPQNPREAAMRSKSTSNLDQDPGGDNRQNSSMGTLPRPTHQAQQAYGGPQSQMPLYAKSSRSTSQPDLAQRKTDSPNDADYENMTGNKDHQLLAGQQPQHPNYMNHMQVRGGGGPQGGYGGRDVRPAQSMPSLQQDQPTQDLTRSRSGEVDPRGQDSKKPYGGVDGDVPRSQTNMPNYQRNFYHNAPPRVNEPYPPFEQLRSSEPREDGDRGNQPRLEAEVPRKATDNRKSQPIFFDPHQQGSGGRQGSPTQAPAARNTPISQQPPYQGPSQTQFAGPPQGNYPATSQYTGSPSGQYAPTSQPPASQAYYYKPSAPGQPAQAPSRYPPKRMDQSPELPPPPPEDVPPELPPPPAEMAGYHEDMPAPPPPPANDYEREIKEEQDKMMRRMSGLGVRNEEPRPERNSQLFQASQRDSGADYQNMDNMAAGGYSQNSYDVSQRAKPAHPQFVQQQPRSAPSDNSMSQQRSENYGNADPSKKKPPPPVAAKPPSVAPKPRLLTAPAIDASRKNSSSPSSSPWEREMKEKEGKQREYELRNYKDMEITELESRRGYLNPDEKERLNKMRVDQEFDRRAQEALSKGDDDGGDSDTDMGDSAAGRAKLLQILQEDVEKRRQQQADERSQRQQRQMAADVEKKEMTDRKLAQLDQELENQRQLQMRRTEKRVQETEDYLKKQREQEQMREIAAARSDRSDPKTRSSMEPHQLHEQMDPHMRKGPTSAPPPPERKSSYDTYRTSAILPKEGEPDPPPMSMRGSSSNPNIKHQDLSGTLGKKSVSFHSNLATEIHEEQRYFPSVSSDTSTIGGQQTPEPSPLPDQSQSPTFQQPSYPTASSKYQPPSSSKPQFVPAQGSNYPPASSQATSSYPKFSQPEQRPSQGSYAANMSAPPPQQPAYHNPMYASAPSHYPPSQPSYPAPPPQVSQGHPTHSPYTNPPQPHQAYPNGPSNQRAVQQPPSHSAPLGYVTSPSVTQNQPNMTTQSYPQQISSGGYPQHQPTYTTSQPSHNYPNIQASQSAYSPYNTPQTQPGSPYNPTQQQPSFPDAYRQAPASMDQARTPESHQSAEQRTVISNTPGVIGANEVYRDPRDRMSANKPLPHHVGPQGEQLSFRDKMKMFAKEIGENTPEEKSKTSRAQQRIEYNMNGR